MKKLLLLSLLLVPIFGAELRKNPFYKRPVYGGPDNTLILRYKFDEGTGTAVADETANNHDATLTGATWNGSGKSGSGDAVVFDGTNDHLATDSTVTYGADIITVCAWVNATYPGGAGTDYLWESGPQVSITANSFNAWADFATFQTEMSGDAFTKDYNQYVPDPTDSTWVHIAIVYDNSTASGDTKVYYDAVEQTVDGGSNDKTGTANFGALTLYIAARGGTTGYIGMTMDDFRIYDGELTQSEISYVKDNPDE